MTTKLSYRPGVGIVVIKPNIGIFAGKRIDKDIDSWQMPQGGIDPGESPYNAAKRELFEETSITSVKLLKQIDQWLYYDVPKEFIPNSWHNKYCGQQQKWFLMEFTGEDKEINIATKEPEFAEWSWINNQEILKHIISFKKDLYIQIFKHFNLIK